MRAVLFVSIAAAGLAGCTTADRNAGYMPAQTITYVQPVAYAAPPPVYPPLAYSQVEPMRDTSAPIEVAEETAYIAEEASYYEDDLEDAPIGGCSELVVC